MRHANRNAGINYNKLECFWRESLTWINEMLCHDIYDFGRRFKFIINRLVKRLIWNRLHRTSRGIYCWNPLEFRFFPQGQKWFRQQIQNCWTSSYLDIFCFTICSFIHCNQISKLRKQKNSYSLLSVYSFTKNI
jgi:hypothetical protein